MDSSASRSSEDDTTKSGGGKAKSDDSKASRQRQPFFIGYNEEFDRKLRETAKQYLIESDVLQDTLLKIYRGEFDKLKPNKKSSSAGTQGSEANDKETDVERNNAEETCGEGD